MLTWYTFCTFSVINNAFKLDNFMMKAPNFILNVSVCNIERDNTATDSATLTIFKFYTIAYNRFQLSCTNLDKFKCFELVSTKTGKHICSKKIAITSVDI
jgi:hypothetical protein